MERKYWFILNADVFTFYKKSMVLLYQTEKGKHAILKGENCVSILKKIDNYSNLGVAELKDSDLKDFHVKKMIEVIVKNKMGKIIPITEDAQKPIVLRPLLSLNEDIDKIKNKDYADYFLGVKFGKYLLNVNIILNEKCNLNCSGCNDYHQQFFCCYSKTTSRKEMPSKLLSELIRQLSFYPLRTINICGGNIYDYQNLELLEEVAESKKLNVYVNYRNYRKHEIIDKAKLHILINYPFKEEKLLDIIQKTSNLDSIFHIIIEDERQHERFSHFLGAYGIEDFYIHPFFTGGNKLFFEKNVYISPNDILNSKLSLREIFRNMKMNSNFFGMLYFFPDGKVRANSNTNILGDIQNEKIIDIIHREMIENTSWRKVRNNEICSKCLYQYLCPPPSNYERVLNTPNLCKKDKMKIKDY